MPRPFFLACAFIACAIVTLPCARADVLTLPPMQYTLFCVKYPADCRSTTESQVQERQWRQLGNINSLINALIIPDAHSNHEWTIYPVRGDCGAFAVTKRHTFLAAGWPSSPLAEVVLRNSQEHHLVLVVVGPSETWVLDNLHDGLMSPEQMSLRYSLVRAQTASDPNIWTTSSPWKG